MKISEYNFFVSTKFLIEIGLLRDGSKFIGYPGRDHRQGGEHFFTTNFENPKCRFSKKAIFEDQKVIYVGSCDSSVLIGVRYTQQI